MNYNKPQAQTPKKKASDFVNYLKGMLGSPYWYGTFGQKATESLYRTKKKQYPSYYTANDFPTQYGKKVVDCIGLLKSYMWSESVQDTHPVYQSNNMPDVSANMFLKQCTRKGAIETMPDVPGIAVFKPGHVGYYIGDGKIIEAKGHKWGVVISDLKSRCFTNWAFIPQLDYDTEN